jgi:hypothetical protein
MVAETHKEYAAIRKDTVRALKDVRVLLDQVKVWTGPDQWRNDAIAQIGRLLERLDKEESSG